MSRPIGGLATMTFCVGIKLEHGLVALADTQIVKGAERLSKGKLALVQHRAQQLFIMTSGLRSVRDKAVIYLEEKLAEAGADFQRLYQVAQAFGDQLRRTRQEDGAALAEGGLSFNLHAIIGGQLDDDPKPTLFYVYPEGNWIEATTDSPYFILGRTLYGKPILDRLLTSETSLAQALALAYLAFDATRTSVIDVAFPIDVIVFDPLTRSLSQQRFDAPALASAVAWWQQCLRTALGEFPMDWAKSLLSNVSLTKSD
jgi:putative proteasome-type protease